DGSIIKEYSLINMLNRIDSLNREKSILKPEQWRRSWDMYETYYHNPSCLEENRLEIAIDDTLTFLGSEKLRKAVKENKLTGLVFKQSYGNHYFLPEEN